LQEKKGKILINQLNKIQRQTKLVGGKTSTNTKRAKH